MLNTPNQGVIYQLQLGLAGIARVADDMGASHPAFGFF